MDDSELMQMLKSIGDLVENIGQVSFTSLCQITVLLRLINNVGKRCRAQFQGNVKKLSCALLSVVTNDCDYVSSEQPCIGENLPFG